MSTPIHPGTAWVFLAKPNTIAERDDARRILSADDLAHVERHRFERDQKIALASRALQRWALSACVSVAPDAWRFAADPQGRPRIVGPILSAPLCFSVANTHELVVCAVTLSLDVGVDVERWRDDVPGELMDHCFAAEERAALRALPAVERPRRFIQLWTVKEAYVKARGAGLALPLDQISVDLGDGPPRLRLNPSLQDQASAWHLASWAPTASHAAALCVRSGGRPIAIDERWMHGTD